MRIPTAEILPQLITRAPDGSYVTLVGRITDYKNYPNIGVLFVKKEDTQGILFITFNSKEKMTYIENSEDVAELEMLWETIKQIETVPGCLGFNERGLVNEYSKNRL